MCGPTLRAGLASPWPQPHGIGCGAGIFGLKRKCGPPMTGGGHHVRDDGATQVRRAHPRQPGPPRLISGVHRGVTSVDRIYSPMPFFWVGGLTMVVLQALSTGAAILAQDVFEAGSTLAAVGA